MLRTVILIVATSRQLATHTRPFSSRDMVFNETTGELRRGPGLWPDMAPAFGAAKADVTVQKATTANITIATALVTGQSIDGVELQAGDLVLVKDQTLPAQNGIYVAGATPARHADFATYDKHAGIHVAVAEGSQGGHAFECTSTTTGTIGTTGIQFQRRDLGVLRRDRVAQLSQLPNASAITDNEFLLMEDANGVLKKVTASVLKTYVTA